MVSNAVNQIFKDMTMTASKAEKKTETTEENADLSNRLEQVFLAGLGAFSTAQEVGVKTFDSLVNQGEDFRKKATDTTEKLIGDVQEAVQEIKEDATSKAEGLFDQVRESSQVTRISSVFDERVAGTLKRMAVPSKADIEVLNDKIDRLIELVEAQAPKKAAAKKTTAKKAPAKKAS